VIKKNYVILIVFISCFSSNIFVSSGTLDTSFNALGIQPGTASTTIDGFTIDNSGYSVAIQQDGKTVVAGYADIGGAYNFAVARFNTNGTLDTSFNSGGAQPGTASTTIDGFAINNTGNSVAIQQDGKIVVAGTADIGGAYNFAVARFNTNGTLDTSFNAAGTQPGTASTTIDNSTYNIGTSVAIQEDGKIVVAGFALIGGTFKFAVARFNTNGTLDTSFNAAEIQPGTASTTIDNSTDNNFGKSVAIQQDGKIVVAGDAFIDGVTKFAVARFNGDAIVAMIDPFALRLIEKYGPRL